MNARTSEYVLVSWNAVRSARVCGVAAVIVGWVLQAVVRPMQRSSTGKRRALIGCPSLCIGANAPQKPDTMRESVGARDGQRPHLFCASIPQDVRTRVERGAGRPHVVHEHDDPFRDHRLNAAASQERRQAKCAPHIAAARTCGKTGLRHCHSTSP